MKWTRGEFWVSDEPKRLDRDAVHRFLRGSYWAKEVPRDVVERAIENSFCFGVYESGSGGQVGFGRAITDYATYAYLSDIYVETAWRRRGLSKWLVEIILGHPQLQNIRRWMLVTQDAQDLYRRFGFRETEHPDWVMEIVRPGLYERWAADGRPR